MVSGGSKQGAGIPGPQASLSLEQLDRRLVGLRVLRRQLKHGLDKLLPKSLIPIIIELSGIPPDSSYIRWERGASSAPDLLKKVL